MQEASSLFILAEVATGLAGFTGVVAALYGRDNWHPFDVWRAVSLLTITFGILITALLPVGLHAVRIDDPNLWRVSSGFALAWIAASVVITHRYQPAGGQAQQGIFGFLLWVVGAICVLLHLLNALGVLGAHFGLFFFALWGGLIAAGLQFANIILLRPEA